MSKILKNRAVKLAATCFRRSVSPHVSKTNFFLHGGKKCMISTMILFDSYILDMKL